MSQSIACPSCKSLISNLKTNLWVCPECNYHFRISAKQRLELIVDKNTFKELNSNLLSNDPLNFYDTKSYKDRYNEACQKTGLTEAIITGTAKINNIPVALGIMDFEFLGGTMGSVVGEKFVRLVELAIDKKLPLIVFTASGGARMQEGTIALMQMAKCSAALKLLNEAKILYISVLTDPTTGGVSVTLGALGDIKIAEPNAIIGFAGKRVVEQTLNTQLPKDFQTAEFVFKNGNLDLIVHRHKLKDTISKLLLLHLKQKGEPKEVKYTPKVVTDFKPLKFEEPIYEIKELIDKCKKLLPKLNNELKRQETEEKLKEYEAKLAELTQYIYSNLTPVQKVQITRASSRPTTLDFINAICTEFIELYGDRQGYDDKAIVTGIGRLFNGYSAVIIGHQKPRNKQEEKERNYGMPMPAGYRKALRLMLHADKFNLPLITFLDTIGAYPGIEAEQQNLVEILGICLREMSYLKVPIISIVNEGGSGGALAIGVANRILMLENAYYSIISPEGAAAILWRDASKADKSAEILKLTAQDLKKLNIIDEIIKEELGGAHNNPELTYQDLRNKLDKALKELCNLSKNQLIKERYNKYRRIGKFIER